MKIGAKYLHKPLKHIINLSLENGMFATKWKMAKLVPIYKGKGNIRTEPGSYRPISLLPIVAKITEKAVKYQVMKHMESNHLINNNHHTYRARLSTTNCCTTTSRCSLGRI